LWVERLFPQRLKEYLAVVKEQGGQVPEPTSVVDVVDLGDVA